MKKQTVEDEIVICCSYSWDTRNNSPKLGKEAEEIEAPKKN